MKNFWIRVVLFTAIMTFSGFAVLYNANASAEGNLDECSWFKSRAMAAGRAGDATSAEHYWRIFYDCMYIPT